MQTAKVLIVGCGDVGTRLARLLIQKGHTVVGLRRKPPKDAPRHIPYFAADVSSIESLSKLDTDFDQVFYVLAPDRRDPAHYRDIYETGLSHLFAHFAKNDTKPHWIFVSSTAVYGVSNGDYIDENSPLQATSLAGEFLIAAEKKIRAHNPQNIIVRFSGIYGEGRERLIRTAHNGTPVQADPPYYSNGIHQDDCAGVLAFLLEKRLSGTTLKSCYLASDDKPTPVFEVVSWLAEKLPQGRAVKKQTDTNTGLNKRCDNGRLKSLGYTFKYPSYREGYLPLLENWQRNTGSEMSNLEKKERIQNIFNDVAKRYDGNHFFPISAKHLLDAIRFEGKGTMLDLCTGTGNVALQAAKRWPDLKIKAIDLSEGMLEEARKKAVGHNLKNIDFVFQDAETLQENTASFDLITCAYGLFFFPHLEDTFRKMMTLLKPGGYFVFSSFTKKAFSPYTDLFLSQLKPYGITLPKPAITRLQSPEEIRSLCQAADVATVEILSQEIRYNIGINDWWALINSAGYKGLLDELGAEKLPAFKAAHVAALEKIAPEGKLVLIADSFYSIVKR